MTQAGSVSIWLERLKHGDGQAAQELWERYYHRLAALARRKLGDMPKKMADEDDVVVSAFKSFFQRAQEGRFPRLEDRDDLWSLLVVITARKATNQIQHERRAKRGGGKVQGESGMDENGEEGGGLASIVCSEPTPDFAAQFTELFQSFMESLDDPTQRLIAVWKFEGRTNPEIANNLDCCVATVERKMRIIRKRLSNHCDVR